MYEFVYMGFWPFSHLTASGDLITSVQTTIVAFLHQPDSLAPPNRCRNRPIAKSQLRRIRLYLLLAFLALDSLITSVRTTIVAFLHQPDSLTPPNRCRNRPIAKSPLIDEFVYMGFWPFSHLTASGDHITSVRTTIVAFLHQPDSRAVPDSSGRAYQTILAPNSRRCRCFLAFHA